MTPSKLKEQLMDMYGIGFQEREWKLIVDIILEQQAALEKIVQAKGSYDHTICIVQLEACNGLASNALASTNEKLKALGCE